jgi:trans-aconitate 2-methyltransferase
MSDWDPESYLRFANERTQPSIDLVSRIRLDSPNEIVDIGCGPGNSTQALRRRWPASDILGLDYSEAMIAKARLDYPDGRWMIADAAKFDSKEKYDLVFSNATLQWIRRHEELLPRLAGGVRRGGALAAQIPMFKEMQINAAIETVAGRSEWRPYAARCAESFTYRDAGFYYGILSGLMGKVDMWITSYIHVLDSHEALIDFCRSTALKPYFECLPSDEARERFEDELLAEIRKRYSLQGDGKLLFPFDRLFFVGYKE